MGGAKKIIILLFKDLISHHDKLFATYCKDTSNCEY